MLTFPVTLLIVSAPVELFQVFDAFVTVISAGNAYPVAAEMVVLNPLHVVDGIAGDAVA